MATPPNSTAVDPTTAEHEAFVAMLRQIPRKCLEAQNAFCHDWPQLLKDHKDQWVAYHGDQPIFFARDDITVLEECIKRGIPENEYNIYCIEEDCPFEPVDLALLD